MQGQEIINHIKNKFYEVGNIIRIPLIKGKGTFKAELSTDGIYVDNLGNKPFLPWDVFIKTVSLLKEKCGEVKKGDATHSRLGQKGLPLDSVEGHIAHKVYEYKEGDSVFPRITPITCILIWTNICQHKTGKLKLSGCKYSDNEWKCPHEILPDSEYCIFHIKDDNKNIVEFNKGINEILNYDEEIINFSGFFFPSGTSDFSQKQFHKNVKFKNVVFSGDADFRQAKFSGDADFHNAKFLKDFARFDFAEFSGNARFYGAKFLGAATFCEAKFSGYTTFYEVKFSGDARFYVAEFSGDTDFNETEFSKDADFSGAKLYGIFYFIPNNSKVIKFNDVFFSDAVRIRANLSQCYFYGSNIEKVDLTDSTWKNYKKKDSRQLPRIYNYFFNSSITIWEASQGKLASNWKTLEVIYRCLKQSHQNSGDYETAGEFYIQERECKRKQLGFFSRHFWNIFYRGFCLYGERPYNVILVSISIIIIFASFYLFHGVEFIGSEFLLIHSSYINYDLSLNSFGFQWLRTNIYFVFKDFLLCIYTSLITFTTLGYGDVHPIGWSRFFASIEAWIGIFMTALFIFVFTRRMMR